MMYLMLDDLIIKKAKQERLAKNTRMITKCVLWTGLGGLIISGTIGIALLGEMVVIGIANKGTKICIKKFKDCRANKANKMSLNIKN